MNGSVVQIPGWFLLVATILMLANTALFIALAFVSFQLWKTVSRVEPKVTQLVDKVNGELVPQVQGLVTRVDTIGSNIQGLTGSASHAINVVGGKTESMASALETLTNVGMKKAEKFAPLLGYVVMGLKVYQMIATVRAAAPKRKARVQKSPALPASAPQPVVENPS